LFLARDRMGQKPLYFSLQNGILGFSSEIAGLTSLIPHEFSEEAAAFYLAYGYSFSGQTIYPGVQQVQPGHVITFADARQSAAQYFDPDEVPPTGAIPPQSTTHQFAQLVQTAVRRQLVSDVSLGVFLSGGIDSSVIAACARREGAVRTFTIRFDDPRYDESPHAAAVARHLGTQHEEFHVSVDAAADLPKLAAAFGEPFGDSSALPTHCLARETRRHVKVALSGDGGDELFGGYDRYRAMRLARRLAPVSALAPLGKKLRGHPKSHAARLGRFLGSLNLSASERYDSYLRFFSDSQIAELMPSAKPPAAVEEIFQAMQKIKPDDVTAALATDRRTYLPNDLLTKVDRCSMLHALEVRSPFMDHELVQFAAGLTTDQLLKGGPKRMLREAFAKDLPDFVFKRKKMGFAVPIGEWFRGELRAMLRDNLFASDSFAKSHFNMNVVQRLIDEHEQERVDHSQRLYALLMLELWWRWHRGLAT
jgi:asparagine synthase (glutamine-hydrolysing)